MVIVHRGRRTRGAALTLSLALVAATACRESTSASHPIVARLTPVVWAGGTLALQVSGLSGPDTLPVIVISGDTVSVRYVAPDSLLVAAPDTQGTFTVWLGLRGRSLLPIGTVQLAGGFSGEWTIPARVGGRPVPWPGAPQTSVVMLADTGIDLVDPRLHTVARQLPGSSFGCPGVTGLGPASGDRIAAPGLGCQLIAVRPDSPAVEPDTGPTSTARFAVRLAPGRWLVAYQQGVASYLRDSGGTWTTAATPYRIVEPYDVTLSPGGDRAIFLGRDFAGTGMPVFERSSPEPLYFLAPFHYVAGAEFSPDGDTLYAVVLSQYTDTTAVLVALDASTGTVLRSAPAWLGTYHLVLDTAQPWIYLVGHDAPEDAPRVHVYDRATFEQVAVLKGRVPALMRDEAYPLLSAAERKLYVVGTCSYCLADQVPVTSFDLMP